MGQNNWADVPGAIYSVLSFKVTKEDAGLYRVKITNANGSVTSEAAEIKVEGVSSLQDAGYIGPGGPGAPTVKQAANCAFSLCLDVGIPHRGLVNLQLISPRGHTKTLLNQPLPAGWYPVSHPYHLVEKGFYLYRLTIDGKSISGKLVIK